MTKCDFCTKSNADGKCFFLSATLRKFYCKKAIEQMNLVAENFNNNKIEEIKHWFEMEIVLTEERMKLKHNPMFNGVEVGHEKQIELNKAHIRYCEYAIMALCKED